MQPQKLARWLQMKIISMNVRRKSDFPLTLMRNLLAIVCQSMAQERISASERRVCTERQDSSAAPLAHKSLNLRRSSQQRQISSQDAARRTI